MREKLTALVAGDASEPMHVAELSLWAATADGVVDRAELEDLVALLRGVPGLESFDVRAAENLVESMAATYATEDAIGARVAEIAGRIRSPAARRTAFQLAIVSAARDGAFSEEESAFLQQLQELLELGDDEADALLRETIE